MAFKRTPTKDVGTTAVKVYDFTGPTSDVVIGMRITNTSSNTITVSAFLRTTAGPTDYYLIGGPIIGNGAVVPVGSSIIIINGDIDKVVLTTNDTIWVTSSAVASADVIISSLTQ